MSATIKPFSPGGATDPAGTTLLLMAASVDVERYIDNIDQYQRCCAPHWASQTEGESSAWMIGLTTEQAAARLGVKRETLYAYVSRGLLHRALDADGRRSRFDPSEIDRLRRRQRPEGEFATLVSTRIARPTDEGVHVRGRDLVAEAALSTFEEAADRIWQAAPGECWPSVADPDEMPDDIGVRLPKPSATHGPAPNRSRTRLCHRSPPRRPVADLRAHGGTPSRMRDGQLSAAALQPPRREHCRHTGGVDWPVGRPASVADQR